MNTNKTTYVAALTYAIENLADAPQDILDKLNALRAHQENRKNYVSKKSIADAEKNEQLASLVKMILSSHGKMTVTEILAADSSFAENRVSNQKVTAILRSLRDSNQVVKLEDKRKTYYKLAE